MLANNTKNSIYRVSDLKSWKNLYLFIFIVNGTKKLVNKLHNIDDNLVSSLPMLVLCEISIVSENAWTPIASHGTSSAKYGASYITL